MVSEFLQLVGIVMRYTAIGRHEPHGMLEYWVEKWIMVHPQNSNILISDDWR